MIESSPYQGADDLYSIQNALAFWIQTSGPCEYYHVGDVTHHLYNGLRGYYPIEQMARIWRDSDTVLAFVIANPRYMAYDAYVSPAHRGGQLEQAVLNWAYTTTREWMNRDGKTDKPVSTDASNCDSIRAKLLTELGYQPEKSPWLNINERTLEADLPPIQLPEGFSIRHAIDESEAEQLSIVHNGAFSSIWTTELYRDEVMLKPGYDPKREWVVVAPDGRFAAFCVIWLDKQNKIGLFEPVGTHSDFQRKGLGRALLAHGLQVMQNHGMKRAQVASETDNPASNGLYQAVGFLPSYQITAYKHD